MTHAERVYAAAQERAATLVTVTQATRRVATLGRQVEAARRSVGLAEERRRAANVRAIARRTGGGNRLQSPSEVKFRQRVADLTIELSVVQERLAALSA